MTESELVKRVGKLKRQNRRFKQRAALGALLIALLLFIGTGGCATEQPKQASVPAPVTVRPYQRFVPIAQGQGFLSFPYWAFDTKTGQLCKTWDWQSNSAPSHKAQESGNTSKLQGLDAAAAGTPMCLALLTEYPDK